MPIDEDGVPRWETLASLISPRTKLVAIGHVSNVTGAIAPVEEVVATARARGVPVLLDAAQSISHMPVDVKRLDVDFLAASSHKAFGPSGIGILYGKRERLRDFPVYQVGGGMVEVNEDLDVAASTRGFVPRDVPFRFEAGTPAIEATIGFGAAISSRENKDTGEWFEQVLPEDLLEYGLIPEFIGRLPVIAAIHQLTRDDLTTILTEPRNALTKQFQRFFEFDDIELVFAEDSLEAIADKALERETGARGLRSILEETLLDVQFELPSRRDVTKCVVSRETIVQGRRPTLVTEAVHQDIGGVDELTEESA